MEQIVEQTHIYRTTWRNRRTIIMWLFNMLLLAFIWWLVSFIPSFNHPSHRTSGDLFYALIMGTFFTWMFYLRDVSLTIDADSIVFAQGQSVVAGGWHDIERIERQSLRSFLFGECIVLYEVRGLPQQWWRRVMVLRPRRFIPLERFDTHWRDGPIGDDLCRYAPWLFDTLHGTP